MIPFLILKHTVKKLTLLAKIPLFGHLEMAADVHSLVVEEAVLVAIVVDMVTIVVYHVHMIPHSKVHVIVVECIITTSAHVTSS